MRGPARLRGSSTIGANLQFGGQDELLNQVGEKKEKAREAAQWMPVILLHFRLVAK